MDFYDHSMTHQCLGPLRYFFPFWRASLFCLANVCALPAFAAVTPLNLSQNARESLAQPCIGLRREMPVSALRFMPASFGSSVCRAILIWWAATTFWEENFRTFNCLPARQRPGGHLKSRQPFPIPRNSFRHLQALPYDRQIRKCIKGEGRCLSGR